jgi:hypothetical protein
VAPLPSAVVDMPTVRFFVTQLARMGRFGLRVAIVPIEFVTGGISLDDSPGEQRHLGRRKLYGHLHAHRFLRSRFVRLARKNDAWTVPDGGLFRLGVDESDCLVSRGGWVAAVEVVASRTVSRWTILTLRFENERLTLVAPTKTAARWVTEIARA